MRKSVFSLPDVPVTSDLVSVGNMVGLRKMAVRPCGRRERNFLPFIHFEPDSAQIGVTFTLVTVDDWLYARQSLDVAKPFVPFLPQHMPAALGPIAFGPPSHILTRNVASTAGQTLAVIAARPRCGDCNLVHPV
jgi:hypothetical protein